MADYNEQVRIDVVLNTRAAIEQLRGLVGEAQNFEQSVTRYGDFLLSSSKKWGVPLKDLQRDFANINKTLMENEGVGLFGENQNFNEVASLSNEYIQASQAANGFRMSQEGVVTSINHVVPSVQKLNTEITKLQKPARNPLGQFMGGTDFSKQLSSITDYQGKLSLVQTTIEKIATKTGASFDQVGQAMNKAFPELQNTNLVAASLENLKNKALGVDGAFKSLAATSSQVDMALAKVQAAGKLDFSKMTGKAAFKDLANTMREIKSGTGASFEQIGASLRKMGVDGQYVRGAMGELNKEMTGFRHGIDVVRTALGTLTAIGIFQFITLMTESFQGATKAARELEDSMFRLSNVERILSQGGVETSMEGLKKGVTEIKKLFPIFSKEDITQLVAQVAISTKELGFTEKQIIDLSKAVGVLNVRSTEEETATQTAQKVISSLITDNARGIAGLGLSFNEASMQAKAMEMGLLKAGESVDNLSNQEKAQVKYQIILENTNQELSNMSDYLDTNTARIKMNQASWHDLLTTIGSIFTSLTPVLSPMLAGLEDAVNAWKSILAVAMGVENTIKAIIGIMPQFLNPFAELSKRGEAFTKFKDAITQLPQVLKANIGDSIKRLFTEGVPDNAPEWFKKRFSQFLIPEDTPTNPFGGIANKAQEEMQNLEKATVDGEAKVTQIMQEARDKRQDIDEQYRRKIEDANRDHQEKLADIARDEQRKYSDAQLNYSRKVEDINRDANEKIAEANQDQRQKEIDREQEYQNKLRELREKFLFSLEDALRERDARQVLRLIREYQMDKKNLEEKRKLDRQEAKKDLATKLADIERDRILKLQAAQRELAEKNAEIALWAARERADAQTALQRKLADARLWHQRELQDYQQYLQRKLQELAKAIIKEYQLTAAGAASIYRLLGSYYGANGSISNLLATGLSSGMNSILSSASSASGGTVSPTWAQAGFYGAAEGGTFVATRPTKVVFGEKGPEMASFTPLGRTGADVGKMFGNGPTPNGGQNYLSLRIALSDGLVSQIVDTSLESVAAVVDRIGKEK